MAMTKQELLLEIANWAGDLQLAAERMTPEAFKAEVMTTYDRMVQVVQKESKEPIWISGMKV